MPTAPTVDAPSVMPNSGGVQISAPDAAFGLSVLGKGLENLGVSAEEHSDTLARHAEAMQAIDNKAAVDGATVSLAQRLGQIGEDFANNNKGIAAHNNLPLAFKDVEKAREELSQTLVSPAARDAYNSASRIATLQTTQRLASFASAERKDYNTKQVQSVVDLAVNATTAENFEQQMDIVAQQLGVLATPQLQGWSPEEFQANYAKVRGAAAYNVTAGLAVEHPSNAQAFYDAHKAGMTPQQRTQAEAVIRNSVENKTVASIADEYTAHAASMGDGTSYLAATHAREGSGKNPYSSADGIGQFTEGTWKKMMARPEFAEDVKGKTPAQILALRSNAGVANKAILAYREENAPILANAGLPVTDATLGLAHGYGPGGAKSILSAPASTPIESIIGKKVAENNRVAGQTTGQVIAEFNRRFDGRGSRVDSLETNAGAAYAAIAQDPRLHGDPTLINRAQSQFLTNVNQARAVDNLATGAAKERLQGAALADNITDPALLQKSYPGALQDWSSLSPNAQRVLTNQLTAAGNAPTALRDSNFLALRGGLVNPNTAAAFAHKDLSGVDLTRGQYQSLVKMQQDTLAKADKAKAIQASMGRALGNEFVKQGIAAAKLKVDTPEYNHFTGALFAEMEDWTSNHPGKKPTDQEIGTMAAGILAKRDVPATWTFMGANTGIGTTTSRAGYDVPEAEATALSAQFKVRYGRDPTDAEVAYFYRKAQ